MELPLDLIDTIGNVIFSATFVLNKKYFCVRGGNFVLSKKVNIKMKLCCR